MLSILNKGTAIMVGLFILTVALMVNDPLGLDPIGFEGTSMIKIWYLLPCLIIWGIIFVKPQFGTRELGAPEEDVRSEKIKSVLRHLLTSLTAIIALNAGLNLKIPYIQPIFDMAQFLLGQSDMVINAIMTLLSFGTVVYGFFKSGLRFEQSAKTNSKGRKYQG
jgi:hypothetical protein